MNQKKEASIKSEKYSEPPDTHINEEKSDQLENLTESLANINTDDPKSLPVTSKTSSLNESVVDKSKEEQTTSVPTNVTQVNDVTKGANDTTLEKGI